MIGKPPNGESAGSRDFTIYAVDEELLRKYLRSIRLVLVFVWFGGIFLFLLKALAEGITFPPPVQWMGVFFFFLCLGPALLYLHAKAASKELTESLGSELIIHGELCSLRRPMRRSFQDVDFSINNLRDAYADAYTLTLVFWKRKQWMRKPLPGFYPTVHLIGVPNAREAALTLSVRSGVAARLHQARCRAKKVRFIAWFVIAAGWLLFFLTLVTFSTVSVDQLAVAAAALLLVSVPLILSTLQVGLHRCKIRLRWTRRKEERTTPREGYGHY